MRVFKCDKCGRYFDEKANLEFVVSGVIYPVPLQVSFGSETYDFCEKCLRETVKDNPRLQKK